MSVKRVLRAWVQKRFWEITDECWAAIEARLKPGMRTLETGSGKSTGLFERAGCHHIALEHDPLRRPHFASVIVAPLIGDPPWFDWEPPRPFDLVFVDGPPGRIGRSGILRVLPQLIHRDTVIVLDDTQRTAERRLAAQIAARYGMTLESGMSRAVGLGILTGLSRGFSILSPMRPRPWR